MVPLFLAGLLASAPDPAGIFGGDPVEPGEWPAVVAVRTTKLCTGTLVAPDLVLTAAHCFEPAPATVEVDFGDDIGAPLFTAAVAEWGAHPDFCLPSDCDGDLHDFAWVRLTAPVAVEPMLPITDQAEYDQVMVGGQSVAFVGIGEDETGVSGTKREVVAEITSFDQSGREFRAGGDGKDTCFGDSGGPALVQVGSGEWRLAGVLSRGGECGKGGIYGVPFPELCWLRDSSGVDLLPGGCGECDCVEIAAEVDSKGCSVPETGWGWGWLLGLVGLVWGWGRGRSRPRA